MSKSLKESLLLPFILVILAVLMAALFLLLLQVLPRVRTVEGVESNESSTRQGQLITFSPQREKRDEMSSRNAAPRSILFIPSFIPAVLASCHVPCCFISFLDLEFSHLIEKGERIDYQNGGKHGKYAARWE